MKANIGKSGGGNDRDGVGVVEVRTVVVRVMG